MNLPGTVSGNWKWRYGPGALRGELSARLRSLTVLYDRDSSSPIAMEENRLR
jgi:4-alpha-glucanotransferase